MRCSTSAGFKCSGAQQNAGWALAARYDKNALCFSAVCFRLDVWMQSKSLRCKVQIPSLNLRAAVRTGSRGCIFARVQRNVAVAHVFSFDSSLNLTALEAPECQARPQGTGTRPLPSRRGRAKVGIDDLRGLLVTVLLGQVEAWSLELGAWRSHSCPVA